MKVQLVRPIYGTGKRSGQHVDSQSRAKCDPQDERPRTHPERSLRRPERESCGRQVRRLRLRNGQSVLRSPVCKHVEEEVRRPGGPRLGPGETPKGARAGGARSRELSFGPAARSFALC